MKRTKNLLIATLLLISVLALTGCYRVQVKNPINKNGGVISVPTLNTTANTAFKPVVFDSAGSHSYYARDFYEARNLEGQDKKSVEQDMEQADKSLSRDVYVMGCNSLFSTSDFRMFGCLMLDGVVYEEYRMRAEDIGSGFIWHDVDSSIPIPTFDKTGIKEPSEFFDEIYDKANEHVSEILFAGSKTPITGTYVLMVNPAGDLYYHFQICEYSYINIDAKNGNILGEYYWNGVYVD